MVSFRLKSHFNLETNLQTHLKAAQYAIKHFQDFKSLKLLLTAHAAIDRKGEEEEEGEGNQKSFLFDFNLNICIFFSSSPFGVSVNDT